MFYGMVCFVIFVTLVCLFKMRWRKSKLEGFMIKQSNPSFRSSRLISARGAQKMEKLSSCGTFTKEFAL